jgi:SDR family mycofactocin-dependent oxidoreductase
MRMIRLDMILGPANEGKSPMGILDGKVAFVTGAARAQGRAHAETLARNGADLVICDIGHDVDELGYSLGTSAELRETALLVEKEGRRVVTMEADVRSQEEVDAVVAAGIAEFGHIDILIANAGVYHLAPLWEITEEQWATVIETNLGGTWRSAKAVIPHMIKAGGGAIVMISSVNGLEPANGYAHYGASKYGVIGLMGSVALEGAPHGIRCNAICPGFVRSGMTTFQGQLDKYAGHPGGTMDDVERAGLSFHPLRDLSYLEPQHIADAALWLVSPGSEAVTGVSVPVDGGHVLVAGRVDRGGGGW